MSAEGKSDKPAQQQNINTTVVQRCNAKVLAADLLCACLVGSFVSVPVSIVDASIMAKVAGVVPTMMHQVKAGAKVALTDPVNFFVRDGKYSFKYNFLYRCVTVVYSSTFIAANWTRSISEGHYKMAPATTAYNCGVVSSFPNIGLTLWKDGNILKVMPRKEGQVASAAAEKVIIPALSRVGFLLRDGLTVMSAFTVVPLVKDHLQATYPESLTPRQAQTISSLLVPCSVQILSTNIHVPAIRYQRMYDPTGRTKWGGPEGYLAGFAQALKADYVGALSLRMVRIGFAFGCGTLLNAELRPMFINAFEPKAFVPM